MLLLDFFRNNRGVRGTISIMLALMLLPIFSLIALMIESARYRSAQQQLSELTYLGQLAIMADYMDYLSSEYSLYAFKGMNNDGKDVLTASFESYVKKTQSAGGIDTRKLNTLFGINIDRCEIQYMYSIADPDVLEYQILQAGRYSMPADVLSKITLQALIQPFKEQLDKVNSFLKKIEKSSSKIKKGTDIAATASAVAANANDLNFKLKNLEIEILKYEEKLDNFKDWKHELNSYYDRFNSTDNGDTFKKMYSKSKNDPRTLEQKKRDETDDKEKIAKLRNALDAFSYNTDTNEIILSDNQAKCLNAFNPSSTTETYKQGDSISFSTIRTLVTNHANNFNNLKYYTGSTTLDLRSSVAYEKSIESLKVDVGGYVAWCNTFDEFEKSSANKALNELNDEADVLNTKYSEYIVALKKYVNSIKTFTDACGEVENIINEAVNDETIAELNESNKKIHDMKINGEKVTSDEYKSHLEDYYKAKSIKNYAKTGSDLVSGFVSKITTDQIDKWQNCFTEKVKELHKLNPNDKKIYNSDDSAGKILVSIGKFINDDYSEYELHKVLCVWDIYTTSNTSLDINDKDSEEILTAVEHMLDEENKSNMEQKIDNCLSEAIMECVYGSLEDLDWNSIHFNEEKAYYFPRSTVIALSAFLAGTAVVDDNTKGIFDMISSVFDALSMTLPADPRLNTHIIGDSSFPSRLEFDEMGTIGILNKKIEGERNGRKFSIGNGEISKIYKENAVGNFNVIDFSNKGQKDYYIYDTSDESDYGEFKNLNIGTSVKDLVKGASTTAKSLRDFIDSIGKMNIIKMIKAVWNLIDGIITFIRGFILFICDIAKVVYALVTNPAAVGEWFVAQLYVSYYANAHFTSRQDVKDKGNYDLDTNMNIFNIDCSDKSGAKSCVKSDPTNTHSNKYKAEMEYFLIGDSCEITNQIYTYYAIFFVRFITNCFVAFKDPTVMGAANIIPWVGPLIIPLFAAFVESKLDLFIMLNGHDVAFFKTQISLFNPKTYETLLKIVDDINNYDSDLVWKMKKDSEGDSKHRDYSTTTLKDKVNKTLDTNVYDPASKGKYNIENPLNKKDNLLAFNYNQYIMALSLFYPKEEKVRRIADLIQMDIRENKDPNFTLSDYYTYIGADVRAEFKPVMPIMSGQSFDALELETILYSGY